MDVWTEIIVYKCCNALTIMVPELLVCNFNPVHFKHALIYYCGIVNEVLGQFCTIGSLESQSC